MNDAPTRRQALTAGWAGLTAIVTGCSTETRSMTETTDDSDVRVIGHRGCADQYPENTVLAMERASPHVDMVEIDVQRCASGELVVFHDDDLDRLTGGSGPVAETDWEVLENLTVLDSDQTIPLLSEILDAVPAATGVNIELKHDGMARDVLEATDGVENELLYSSFSVSALRELRSESEAIDLALVIGDASGTPIQTADSLDCVAIHPNYDLVLSTEFRRTAHDNGFAVNTWTVDDADTASRLIDAGVDGLFVDRWDIV